MAPPPGDLATHGKRLLKLLPCAKYRDIQSATEPCHIMHLYNAYLGKLSTFWPVYPGVGWLCLGHAGIQPHVE